MPSASLVPQPKGARQLKMGTGLTLIEIEKLSVGVQCEGVHELPHMTDHFRTWTTKFSWTFGGREVHKGRQQSSVLCERLTDYLPD